MTPIERRYQRLLRAYPRWYREQRGDEMLGTLMAAAPSGRWPSARDSRALIIGGVRVRAGQDQRLGTRANLRLAALLGVVLSLIGSTAIELAGIDMRGTHTFVYYPTGAMLACGLLTLAAVAAAWFAPWWVTAPLALATSGLWLAWFSDLMTPRHPGLLLVPLTLAAVAAVWFAPWWVTAPLVLATSGLWLAWFSDLVMFLHPGLLLVPLAALVRGPHRLPRHRLPRHWLVLAGAVFIASTLESLGSLGGLQFVRGPVGPVPVGLAILVAWVIFGLVVLWAVVDARPALALALYLLLKSLSTTWIGYFGWGVMPLAAWTVWLPAAGAAALALGAIWRIRRQTVL